MNKPCDVELSSNENAIRRGTPGWPHIRMVETIHVVSVGPVDCGSKVHDALFDRKSFRLSIATDYRKLWELPANESVHVAVLHNTLSSFELEAACRLIRRRWPSAKILLVSREESFLDDGLYDDRAPTVDSDVLLSTIERLTGRWYDAPQVKFLVPAETRMREDSFVTSGNGLRRGRWRSHANWRGRRGGRPPRSLAESPAGPVPETVEHQEG